uniref:Uncharacterized protein n=1 Tax=viral metagenome TaxID=1070528 RepID=A0A6M3JH47_9ZZZZ
MNTILEYLGAGLLLLAILIVAIICFIGFGLVYIKDFIKELYERM